MLMLLNLLLKEKLVLIEQEEMLVYMQLNIMLVVEEVQLEEQDKVD